MASVSFTKRFKNKFEKIGRQGLHTLKTLNPVEKLDIPSSKLHKSIVTLLPHQPKSGFSHQPSYDDLKYSSSRSISSSKLMPSVKLGSDKLVLFRNISRLPNDSKEKILSISGRSKVSESSCISLPKLNKGYYNLKKIMRKKLVPIKNLKQESEEIN